MDIIKVKNGWKYGDLLFMKFEDAVKCKAATELMSTWRIKAKYFTKEMMKKVEK
jgi:hypothetical protein